MPVTTLIFDLSEVFISGLKGVELYLSDVLRLDRNQILEAFGGVNLASICIGKITENQYLASIIETQQWSIPRSELKKNIRLNFNRAVPGMNHLLDLIPAHYQLVIHSDHAREWIDYIANYHTFLDQFDRQV